jgi:hypothetical protein
MVKIIHLILSLIIFEGLCDSPKEKSTFNKKKKILIFSYGSLVVQKENKKTGKQLQATAFTMTNIKVPISFAFIAGLPPHLIKTNKKNWKSFPLRRATATIDRFSKDYKPLWFAFSKKDTLPEALNNLAAREGASKVRKSQRYDTTYLFYIKRVTQNYKKLNSEKWIPGLTNWVTKKPWYRSQQLSNECLKEIVHFTQKQKADVAIWAALPSNITNRELVTIIKNDKVFTKNTQAYIKKMPPGNKLSSLEHRVLSINSSF